MKQRIEEIAGITVGYHTTLCELNIDTAQLGYPEGFACTAQVQQLRNGTIEKEIIRAKYVIGADGGKSMTRKVLDIGMDGVQGTSIWGVMDFAGSSDFPE
ncbi:FAD binding domain protein [Penicillium diatomitis]|uniref:FAD binding domain protein n=1 Tax=Penicillium diatomitis TaxID=2819901 RepID=A0A9X0BXS0_9EURO|nr:FAD binding domain protein [Penicillium diatomitis]KAJ5488457.1 FAD binding domain protein [Penicillium diatomitis]